MGEARLAKAAASGLEGRGQGGCPRSSGSPPGVNEAEPEEVLWSGAAGRAQRLGRHP